MVSSRRELLLALGALPIFGQGVSTRTAHPTPRGKPSGLPFHSKLTDIAAEAGLHQFISTHIGGKCLVDASELPLRGAKENTFYLPPAGIERRGAIGAQAKRRIIHVDRGMVEDVHLDRKQSWDGNSLANLVAELMEENLRNNARGLLTS